MRSEGVEASYDIEVPGELRSFNPDDGNERRLLSVPMAPETGCPKVRCLVSAAMNRLNFGPSPNLDAGIAPLVT